MSWLEKMSQHTQKGWLTKPKELLHIYVAQVEADVSQSSHMIGFL